MDEAINQIAKALPDFWVAFGESWYMLLISIPITVLLGVPLGTVLYFIRPGSRFKAPRTYILLNGLVNIVRSFPFIVLLIAIIPITRLIVGTALGTTAVIVPLVVASTPYFARFIEQSLLEINRGLIEAAESMGASLPRIIWSVLYVEARSSIVNSIVIILVSFLNYSSVAGLVGGGGLGDFALRYGYQRYETYTMAFTIIVIVICVQLFQFVGNYIVSKLDKRL
ncbi:methionine ABC transporter permease [Paenibacillus sp. NPDC058071]|uniref:methionine ABC transporter permease n=1 Tax=Paenibacillus sp. NPDC058071 TaxID=3346326 RepID=UPI0036DF5134